MEMRIRRLVLAVPALVLACAASAAEYRLTPQPATADVRVEIKLDKPSRVFRMCGWAPGDYEMFNYGKVVQQIEFRQGGKRVSAKQGVDQNMWEIPGGADEVVYIAKPSSGNFSPNLRVRPDETFVSGPGVLGWFEGHDRQKQTLEVALVPQGAKAYSTLDKKSGRRGWQTLSAPNFDEMIDAPLVVGTSVREQAFQVRGKLHRIIAFGQNRAVDLAGFAAVATRAVEGGFQLFGELPYPNYAFFMDFGGQGGGLEHMNSCRVGISSRAQPQQIAGLLFHEYMHTFNVKRIRSKPLGPFDYTKPAVTGALWWLEGVTDYYGTLLQYRSGQIDQANALRNFGWEIRGLNRSEARLRVSADEASRRVWETRGSFGFGGLSYYAKGHVLGIYLDLAIRGHSQGRHSLDDVIRKLYAETKGNRPGFDEGRIRALCIEFGGAGMGSLYDRGVMQAGELPWNEVLPRVGLMLTEEGLAFDPEAGTASRVLGEAWLARG